MSIITLTPTAPVSPADLIWEEPPAPKNASTGAYAGVAAALKARPGEWAVLRTFGSTTSEKKRVRDGLARPITTPDQIIRDCQDAPGGRHRHPDADRIVGIEHHRRMRDLARLIREAHDGPSAA